jgi:nucleoside-diphosphate-sugar epimerase
MKSKILVTGAIYIGSTLCKRLREAGFEAKRTLEDGIKELLKGYKMLGRTRFKNI